MTRAERLNERFRLIQTTLEELHGKPLAFAAAAAAWLRAIQHGQKQALLEVRKFTSLDSVAYAAAKEEVDRLEAESEVMLRGFHQELCSHLNVDPAEAIKVSKAFEQVVRDICFQGG